MEGVGWWPQPCTNMGLAAPSLLLRAPGSDRQTPTFSTLLYPPIPPLPPPLWQTPHANTRDSHNIYVLWRAFKSNLSVSSRVIDVFFIVITPLPWRENAMLKWNRIRMLLSVEVSYFLIPIHFIRRAGQYNVNWEVWLLTIFLTRTLSITCWSRMDVGINRYLWECNIFIA